MQFNYQAWQHCPLQGALVLLHPVPLEGPHTLVPLTVAVPDPQQSPLLLHLLHDDVPQRDGDAKPEGAAQEK